MPYVKYQKDGKVVTITLNRPDKMNALNGTVINELRESFEKFDADNGALVAILTGTGRAFCAGFDLAEFAAPDKPGIGASFDTFEKQDPSLRLREVTKPVVGAFNGFAMAAGFELVVACDIRIAAESAKFGMSEINVGLFGWSDNYFVQGVPLCQLMEMALTGDPISARKAQEIGLINQVVADSELMPVAQKVAGRIASHPPLSVRLNKQVPMQAVRSLRQTWDLFMGAQKALMQSEDHVEAARAFIEKRPRDTRANSPGP
jgi:enoyl-CoA hydratase